MADITARLIWYRLGEAADNVRTYIMDEDVDVLDVLFLMWVLLAILVLALVYGFEWLTKSSCARSRDPGGISLDEQQRRWHQMKRQHSFFDVVPAPPGTALEHRPEDEQEVRVEVQEAAVKAAVVEATQLAPGATARSNGSVGGDGDHRSRNFSHLRQQQQTKAKAGPGGDAGARLTPDHNCQWMNKLIMWLYLNYSQTPAWLSAWLGALNADLERKAKGEQVRLELVSVTPGSMPPKIISWSSEPDDDTRCLFIRSCVTVSEFGFRVRLVRQNARTTASEGSCNVMLRNFVGEIRISVEMGENLEGIRVLVKFTKKPQMDVTVIRSDESAHSRSKRPLDIDWVKHQVVLALEESITEVTFREPLMATRGDTRGVDAVLAAALASTTSSSASGNRKPMRVVNESASGHEASMTGNEVHQEEEMVAVRTVRIEASAPSGGDKAEEGVGLRSGAQAHSDETKPRPTSTSSSTIPRFFTGQRTFANRNTVPNGSVNRPLLLSTNANSTSASGQASGEVSPRLPSPMRSPIRELAKGQTILTKVIKVTGVSSGGHRIAGPKERGLYCVVEMDEPYQRHTTNVVRGSTSAFWDQSFYLELNTNSQRVNFAVFDGESQKDATLGQTTVPVRDLMAHPSSRQIIPLRVDPNSSKRRSKEKDGQPGGGQPSITVEFLFLLPNKNTTSSPRPPCEDPIARSQVKPNFTTAPTNPTKAPSAQPKPSEASGDRSQVKYTTQTSTTSSSTSATSTSTASSADDGAGKTTQAKEAAAPRPVSGSNGFPRVPQAIVITAPDNSGAVNSREVANFMSPPTPILGPSGTRPVASEPVAAVQKVREETPPPRNEPRRDHHQRYEAPRGPERPAVRPQAPETVSIPLPAPSSAPRSSATSGEPEIEVLEDTASSSVMRNTPSPRPEGDIAADRGRSSKPQRPTSGKRSRSFASRLRKTFTPRSRSKERSHSVDRLSNNNSLHPPDPAHPSGTSPISSQSSLQKSKSLGLSGSFRRIFGGGGKRHKSHAANDYSHPATEPVVIDWPVDSCSLALH